MTKKRTLTFAGVVLLIVAIGFWQAYSRIFENMAPRQGDRIEITPNVIGVYTGLSYAYLIFGERTVALIDAGSDTEGVAIMAELKRHNRQPNQVAAIMLTHGHRDHYAAAHLFPVAQVFVAPEDLELAWGDKSAKAFGSKLMTRFGKKPPHPNNMRQVLPGGIVQAAGFQFEVIGTPGHTRGSTMFKLGHILFSGDGLLVGKSTGVTLAPKIFTESMELAGKALTRIPSEEVSVLADGHVGMTRELQKGLKHWFEAN